MTGSKLQRFLRTASWGIRLVLLVIGVAIVLGLMAGLLAGLISPVVAAAWVLLSPILFAGVAGALHRVRDGRASRVLLYVNQLLRMNHPLPQGLLAAARSERGVVSRRLERLGELFFDGSHRFGEAVEMALPELPRYEARRLAVAEATGQLPAALGRLVDRHRFNADRVANRLTSHAYALGVVIAVLLMTSWLSMFVLPMFGDIFTDYETPLPRATAVIFAWITRHGVLLQVIAALAGLYILLSTAAAILQLLVARRPPTAGLGRWALSHVPPFRKLHRDEQHAEALSLLSRSAAGGVPIDKALGEVATMSMVGPARRGFRRWAASTRRGEAIEIGARRAGLGRHGTRLVASSLRTGTLPEALDFLATRSRMAAVRRQAWIEAIGVPLLILLLGLMVGWFVYALMLPLEALITSSTETALNPR